MNSTHLAAVMTALGLAATGHAEELGKVLSSVPIVQAVTVQRQVCTPQQVVTAPPKTGAGAVMGAIAGGAMGNAVGGGSGRAVATGVGIIGGAILGDKIEGGGAPQTQMVQQCSLQNVVENRVTAYNVTYEYAGKQFSAQMPSDPGPFVRLQIVPIGGAAVAPAGMTPPATTH